MTNLTEIKNELTKQIGNDKETLVLLLQTTFKGLTEPKAKQAMMEAMMRGFVFQDFLENNIYAIPFGSSYSLVTSIDYARKIGMRSGVVGKSEPFFEEDNKKNIISCKITIKKKVGEHIGDYTSKVYFNEYNTNKNLWKFKPRTMISKVAEMHALRMACPEELSQAYIEEEYQKDDKKIMVELDIDEYEKRIKETKNLEELKDAWALLPAEAKMKLIDLKNSLKKKYEKSKTN